MAAPTGNKFWQIRSKHGRDTIFESPQHMWEAACEYFEWCEKHPLIAEEIQGGKRFKVKKLRAFTLEGLCIYLDVNTKYFYDFEKTCSKDFSHIVTRIKETIRTQKYSGAASGLLKENIIMRDLGLFEKVEQHNTNTNTNINSEPLSVDKIREIGKALEDDY